MGPEDQHQHPDQPEPLSPEQIAAALAALANRVTTLEGALKHALAQLRPATALQPIPPPPPPPPPRPVSPPNFAQHLPAASPSLEDRIGAQLFSRVGIVALLIAITLFLKWAIDNHWIGPVGRIVAGLIAGAAIILWSERFRRHGFPAFSYSLKAVGSGALYLSLWAAFQLYGLLPSGVALGAMVLVTAWNAFMAWTQNSELLAAYALAGGLATPPLLSSGGNHETFLFLYLLAIDIATVLLVRLKPWPRLLFGAFPATVVFFIAWYVDWYGALGTQAPLATTSVFIALSFITFTLPSLQTTREASSLSPITHILLPLGNAAFASLALYSVLQDAGHHDLLPWMAVLFAAFYLGLMRLPQPSTTAALHLALAVVFLTIAIPLKATGRWITVGWLAEGAALMGVSALLSASAETVHRILRRLACAALALGFLSVFLQPLFDPDRFQSSPTGSYSQETAFLNPYFLTALFSLFTFALSAWIAHHASRSPINATDLSDGPPKPIATPSWLEIAAVSIIAFNLIAIFAIVRELDLLWITTTANPEADLQRSLAISGFLMLYGALVLAAGFWRRSAFLRWQALLLLVFTIAKTFLYDLRSLTEGYRILSFLGLGALLMTISFAYQKDWLALRALAPTSTQPTSHEEANP